MRYRSAPGHRAGFTLVEVMVSLIIICVGLLGIAKLEGLMLSNTGTSRLRSLVALQAASLADAMHANRDYWADGAAVTGTTVYWNPTNGALSLSATETNGVTTFTGTNAPAAGNPSCAESAPGSGVAACTSLQLADYDLNTWANGANGLPGLNAVLQNSTSSINCALVTGGTVSCTIAITWTESSVAATKQEATVAAAGAGQQQTYTLVVQP